MSAMDLIKSMMVAASGLKAQSGRMRVIAENIANADSTAKTPGGDPYRRKIVTFEQNLDRELGVRTVSLGRPVLDKADFQMKYLPGHPAADANGYVKMPNVNGLIESMDMREAQRSYEANLNLIQASRRMISQTIGILKK
jgi:flagellar basal-body rod protein FlgC